ncbi:GNAT family N-acetyltransferase [Arthrobacter livingstonensis]|uniref:GNAT family N-acetyltransferase n=1 Tax=Arthrobacter livingstonensis TaxID=670078 RepID=A0A2V5L735_9MICC|nr:GNAT family N-acetyltransferase [Arthrobacter livingstonensis]PYI67285.1 GNAT family N-acetyltransferase [Arthrobacter livingstonensis]
MTDMRIEQLRVPETLQGDGAVDFLRAVEVSRQVRAGTWGNDDLAYTGEEMLALCHDPYEWYVVLVARLDGEIVGRAGIAMPLDDHTELAHVTLDVLPAVEGHGLGRRLLEAAESFVRGENRRVVVVETNHSAHDLPVQGKPAGDGGLLHAANGTGALPVENRQARFAHNAGYGLERVEQFSSCRLPFPGDRAAELKESAAAAHGSDYALHQWTDHCPEEWAGDVARLEQGMGAPAGEGQWDVARLREAEELSQTTGRHTLVTAAEYVTSGHLVGYTSISVLGHRDDVVFQDDTVMEDEHRGRELGLKMKLANLELLTREFPQSHTIYTWNAAENTSMININARMGFANAGVTGQWRKSFDSGE